MAGGRFDKLVGKVRPGTYINFESGRETDILSAGTRGTVIVPLPKAAYGPAKQFIRLTNASPDAEAATLGYSIYDSDPNRQMLLIREAFKRATTVYVYILTEGKKAQAEITMSVPAESEEAGATTNTLTAAAKHGGSRGNAFTVTLDANPLGGYDVLIHLDGGKVTEYEGLNTVEELIAQGNPYITFSGAGKLGEAAGTNLTGGEDEEATNTDITDFIDAWEKVKFHTVCFPFNGEEAQNVKQAALTKIRYMRDSMGKGVQVVMPDAGGMDYEGVINVTNSVSLDGDNLSHAEVCAWVAGATAGATNTESLTYKQYAGATAVVDPKSNEEAIAAINAGEFFFSVNEDREIVVEYDINSLTTFADKKDKSYRKNRVIRVYDTFQEAVQLNFPPNKFNNNARGWDIMEGIGKTILRQFEDAEAITNVSYDEDFLVDRESSVDDETYFNVGLQAVDSAEKLYFTITTR
ncbi:MULTISPECIES: phage tail sheath subtilisin-like domain-containing protein [Eubacteriales]|jgi:hypothetical protein|uniref:phage tail sheath subtilisin-like domain-containing protein n=1 Tax=Eubacteriales TaxID=186802 RepID=UPI00272CACB0|nr:phage tail sheath subtilisin-like domain-containing protein [Acutalibacter muris]